MEGNIMEATLEATSGVSAWEDEAGSVRWQHPIDVEAIRRDFPILNRQIRGKPLIYLDNAATSQKPACVIDALADYYTQYNANVHRGIHTLAEEATVAYEEARQKVARFIGAASPSSIVFTRNTSEAINLVAYTWGRTHLKKGDRILLTEMEHHSNLVPWQLLAKETGAELAFIGMFHDGTLNLDELEALIWKQTKLVCMTQMSNVLGTINPVKRIAEVAHKNGALILIDGAQSVPHLPVDVVDLDCDFLAFSSHKMLGPTGIGVLYGREELLEEMPPFLGGGEMIREVRFDRATWNDIPWKFEAGTPNIADAIAFGAAIDYLNGIGMARIREHEEGLTQYVLEAFYKLDDVTIYGPKDAHMRGGVIAFNYAGVHPHDLGTFLDNEGIAIRAGHHCAQPLMRRLGVVATARASFYLYNCEEEIDLLVGALKKAKRFFQPWR